jgi:hypothetical protein
MFKRGRDEGVIWPLRAITIWLSAHTANGKKTPGRRKVRASPRFGGHFRLERDDFSTNQHPLQIAA